MKMKPVYAAYFIVGLLVLFAGLKIHQYLTREFEEWEAVVEAKTDSLAQLKDRITEDSARIVESEAELAAVRDSALRAIETADSTADVAVSEAERLYEELVNQSPPELTPVFQAWRDSWMQALAAKDTVIINERRIRTRQDTLLAQYRQINDDLHEALRRSEELTEFWKGKAQRSWYEKWQIVAPVTAGATLVGVGLLATVLPD
jgi:chromosome segregation ATPase